MNTALSESKSSKFDNALMTPSYIIRAARRGVFISYTRSDELFALDLTESLRAAGVSTWLDMTDIPDDADWYNAVSTALYRCGVMLALLSPEALENREMRGEQQQFLRAGKIVIPILYKTGDFSMLNLPYPPVDFRHDFALGVQQLLKMLTVR